MLLCANPLAQYESHKAEIDQAVARVLAGTRYILGPEVEALEKEFAEYIGTSHGIGVANGTDAIELAVRALGIGEGDEVITVSHTAVATVAAIEATGASAVLVDVDPEFFTLDPAQLRAARTDRTRAVIAVHLYGQPADVDAIAAFCAKHALYFIEDCSQAHGAKWKGKRTGGIGVIGCFSCYPTKNLGAIGDGGLVTTSDAALAERIRMLREYGWKERYVSDITGRNSRLDEIQAAILRVKLRHLEADTAKRKALAARYDAALAGTGVVVPKVREGAEHVYHLYAIRTQRRAELIDHLKSRDIFPGIHFPVPIHLQPAYAGRVRSAASMKESERISDDVLSLPLYPELSFADVDRVAAAIKEFAGAKPRS